MGDRSTKPSSSMISRLRRDSFRCRLSSRRSSLASSGPLYPFFTGATPQRGYPAGVLRQHGTAGPPALAGNSPVYGPGCKSPLPVAEEVAGNSGCRILGRILYISYSSTPRSCILTGPDHLPSSAV